MAGAVRCPAAPPLHLAPDRRGGAPPSPPIAASTRWMQVTLARHARRPRGLPLPARQILPGEGQRVGLARVQQRRQQHPDLVLAQSVLVPVADTLGGVQETGFQLPHRFLPQPFSPQLAVRRLVDRLVVGQRPEVEAGRGHPAPLLMPARQPTGLVFGWLGERHLAPGQEAIPVERPVRAIQRHHQAGAEMHRALHRIVRDRRGFPAPERPGAQRRLERIEQVRDGGTVGGGKPSFGEDTALLRA